MKRFALALKPIRQTTLCHRYEDGSVLRGNIFFEENKRFLSRRRWLTLRIVVFAALAVMLTCPNIEADVAQKTWIEQPSVELLANGACGDGVQSDGELCFLPSALATTSIGGEPSGVAVGFLDSDANPDFVMSNTGTDQIRIKLGDGNGAFPSTFVYTMGDGPTDVAIADFNNDGFKDIIATNVYAGLVRIRWGHTNWGSWSQWTTGDGPWRVAVGDLNGDGRGDFVTTNISDDTLTVRRRLAGGGFDTQTYSAGDSAYDIELADCDNDGDLDLVYPVGLTIKVRRNNGAGSFGAALTTNMGIGGNYFASVTLGDYAEDGQLDLIAARNDHTLVRVLGDGDGTFSNPVAAPVGNNPFQLVTADLDLDGNRDVVMTHVLEDRISIIRGQGNGNFVGPYEFAAASHTYDVGAGDFNTDGTPDLVYTASGGAYVMLSNP